jgi:hypothetical protein
VDANLFLQSFTPGTPAGQLANADLGVTGLRDLPIIRGGKLNVEVIAYLPQAGGLTPTSLQNVYYLPSKPATKSIDKEPVLLTQPTSFTATANAYGDVTLAWTNPETATGNQIYRFVGNSGAYAAGTPGVIFEDWKNITKDIQATLRETTNGSSLTQKSWAAVDFPGELLPGQYLFYAIIATNGNKKSAAVLSSQVTSQLTGNEPVLTVSFEGGAGWWNNLEEKKSRVKLQWIANETDFYTYEVYRAAAVSDGATIIKPLNGADWTKNEAWEKITSAVTVSAEGSSGATATIYDTPALRNAYRYKLVTTAPTNAGIKSADKKVMEAYADLTTYPYQTNRVNVGLSVTDPTLSPTSTTGGTAYQLEYKISATDRGIAQLKEILKDGETIKIFRTTGTQSNDVSANFGEVSGITSLTKASVHNGILKTETVGNGYFNYRVEVVGTDGKYLLNANRDLYDQSPKPGVTTVNKVAGSAANTVKFQVTGANPNDYLVGTKLIVKYAVSTVSSADAIARFNDPATVIINDGVTLVQDSTPTTTYNSSKDDFEGTTAARWVYGAVYLKTGNYVDGGTLTPVFSASLF